MRQQMNVHVGGLKNESAWPWRFYSVSGSELLKATGATWVKSQYAEKKKKHGEGEAASHRDMLRRTRLVSATKHLFHKGKHTWVNCFAQ